MSEEKNKHQRPLHRFPVPLNSDKSRFEIVPRIEHFNVMTRPGQAMRSEQADTFLLALSGLVHWLSWTVFAVNTGENIAVNSQFSVSEQDSSLLTSALAASFPASDFARGNNIYQVLLANIVTNREHYRQCELELCDIHELQKKDHWSNTRLFGVASALDPGEALFQDVIAFPAQYERGIATAFNTSIRYGIVTSKGLKEKFRKALFGEDEEFYTLSDFMRQGF